MQPVIVPRVGRAHPACCDTPALSEEHIGKTGKCTAILVAGIWSRVFAMVLVGAFLMPFLTKRNAGQEGG